MILPDLTDSTLVLLGHGSTLNGDSDGPTYQHAEELRRRGIFGQVLESFWKQEPSFCAVLRGAIGKRVFCVPLFISEGYFTEQVIPRELGLCEKGAAVQAPIVRELGGRQIYYCGPVGTHDSMTRVLVSRARETTEKFPFPRAPKPAETTLFIAGHGTGNSENSRKAIEHQVELIRQQGVYADVQASFMEEEPKIGECYARAKTKNIVMVPFFIADGLHSYEDIPVMLGEPEAVVQKRFKEGQPTWRNPTEKNGKLVWYTPSIGNEPLVADVILERVAEAVGAIAVQ